MILDNKKSKFSSRYFKGKELTGDRYVMKLKKMVGKWTVTMNMKV